MWVFFFFFFFFLKKKQKHETTVEKTGWKLSLKTCTVQARQ